MNGYRVCLDCDKKVATAGDELHKINGDGNLVGCEGYIHRGVYEGIVVNDEVQMVYNIAGEVHAAFTTTCLLSGNLYSEDFADAFHSVGQLFMEISAKMLHEVYKDDNDQDVKDHMDMMLRQATSDGDEARSTLRDGWNIPTSIDDI